MNPTPQATATAAPRNRQITAVSAAAITALALVFFMISSVTGAAWTATTDNIGNSWAAGEVSLTDDAESVMFAATNMVPGTVVDNSITVTNESTVPLSVRLYGAELDDADELALHLNLKIGTTAGGDDVYAGTLAGFAGSHDEFADGTAIIELGTEVGVDDSQTYHFWVELAANAPQVLEGKSAGIDFVWEGTTDLE